MNQYLELNLSGNFQYDAGLLGFIKILEKFYPQKYELTDEILKFTKDILIDFNVAWFKMILLQNDIFNNSMYSLKFDKNKITVKKIPNKKYRDEIIKILEIDSKNDQINKTQNKIKQDLNNKIDTLNKDIKQLIEKKTIQEILSDIKMKGLLFIDDIIKMLNLKLTEMLANDILNKKNLDKKLKDLKKLEDGLKTDIEGRLENIKKGSLIRALLTPYNFNKGMFNTGGKEDIYGMIDGFKKEYIDSIFNIETAEVEKSEINCDFCGVYKVKIDNYNDLIEPKKSILDRTHLFGTVSKKGFSNLYWFGQPNIFFCDLCELIMMCTIFGFSNKERNSDLDKTNKIFIHSPSLKIMKNLNFIEGKRFSFEEFLGQLLDRIDIEKQKMKYILGNILFIELQAEGQNTKFKSLHINSQTAEFIINNYNLLKEIKGRVVIEEGTKKVRIDIRYEILKSILEGIRDIQDFINLVILESINKENIPYIFIKGLTIIQYRLKGGNMENVIHRFYQEGEIFSKKLSDWNKKRGTVYSLMQAIRGNNQRKFLDDIFNIYLPYKKAIPRELQQVIDNKIPFQDVGNAFIAGLLSKIPKDDSLNVGTEDDSLDNNEDNESTEEEE